MKKAVCIIIACTCGKILGASRKYDHSDIGLIGGSVEPGEEPEEAAARELREETGITVIEDIILLDVRPYRDEEVYTYTIKTPQRPLSNEKLLTRGEGILKWVRPEDLERGEFGDFNKALFETLRQNAYTSRP